MTIKDMQYDFKQKLNKLDSQQYRNLRIPEIDWKLNEALEIFVKSIAEPRSNPRFGFETSQRTIDDIRTIVVDSLVIVPTLISEKEYYIELPNDYQFYVSSRITINREECGSKEAVSILIKHDNRSNEAAFYTSSYEWGEVNIRFYDKGIKLFTDGTFNIENIKLSYIRKHPYIHNAQDFLPTKTYKLPSGELLSGTQDCELPTHTHREIVDIAVLITSGDLQSGDYQLKQAKVNLNQN